MWIRLSARDDAHLKGSSIGWIQKRFPLSGPML
jgi:hypothetical protein